MPLISVHNLTKYYGTDLILDGVSLSIDNRDRLGLIGANGTGKTTLCRILMGLESYEDNAQIHRARGMTVGYLSQDVDFGAASTPWEVVMAVYGEMRRREEEIRKLEEEMAAETDRDQLAELLEEHERLTAHHIAAGGYEYERRAATVLTGLGVPEADFRREIASFSGGEQRRVALAQLLLKEPDLVLLDEPTNHLDIQGIEWLEGYLKSYPGAVVCISHDRRFLDSVARRILELEACDLTEYRGGYSDYLHQKEERLLTYSRQYERQQQELKKQMAFIRWALGTQQEKKVRAAKSRLKLLSKMEYLEPPPAQARQMNLRFEPKMRGGEEILELTRVGMSFGERRLFSDVNLFVRRGERVGIVGPNGCGKTTLLQIILGNLQPTEGKARLGASVEIGYHRQDEFGLTPDFTVFQEFRQILPTADQGEIRSLLARFLFVEDDVFKRVGDLSGGEQSRLSLAKLILTQPTVLVLDEPTNHLDIDSRNALEHALRDYRGTVIVVSHDRYFLDNVVNRVVVMGGGTAVVHQGNYASYVAKREAIQQEREAERREREEQERRDRQRQERLARQNRKDKRPRSAGEQLPTAEELEERAAYLEKQLEKVHRILGDPATYDQPARAQALSAEHEKLSSELRTVYELWERVVAEDG